MPRSRLLQALLLTLEATTVLLGSEAGTVIARPPITAVVTIVHPPAEATRQPPRVATAVILHGWVLQTTLQV